MIISVAFGTFTPTSMTVVCDENIEPACGELTHGGVFFGGLHLAVHASDAKVRERFRESFGPRRRRLEFIFSAYILISEVDQTYVLLRDFPALRFLDGGADDICLGDLRRADGV